MLQEIKGLREELSTRLNSSDTLEIIREKEEQIRGLLEEGTAKKLVLLAIRHDRNHEHVRLIKINQNS